MGYFKSKRPILVETGAAEDNIQTDVLEVNSTATIAAANIPTLVSTGSITAEGLTSTGALTANSVTSTGTITAETVNSSDAAVTNLTVSSSADVVALNCSSEATIVNLTVSSSADITELNLGGALYSTGAIYLENGAAATPTYTFSSQTGTGMWRDNNQLSFSVGGSEEFQIRLDRIRLRSNWVAFDISEGITATPSSSNDTLTFTGRAVFDGGITNSSGNRTNVTNTTGAAGTGGTLSTALALIGIHSLTSTSTTGSTGASIWTLAVPTAGDVVRFAVTSVGDSASTATPFRLYASTGAAYWDSTSVVVDLSTLGAHLELTAITSTWWQVTGGSGYALGSST